MANPYLSLLSTAWRYAREERRYIVLVYLLFLGSNVLFAAQTVLLGWFVNALQREGWQVTTAGWLYAGGCFGLQLARWAFHGPAQVMNRRLAFNISQNFLDDIHNQLLHLPVDWHQDHHSGSTNNRLRKAYGALRDFYQNGFMYFYSLTQFIISLGAMIYFSLLFGGLAILLGLGTIRLIFYFDRPLIKSIEEVNEKEHKVYSALSDGLSNITSVITLRLEKHIRAELIQKLRNVFSAYYRTGKISESKWFATAMLVILIDGIMVMGYIYERSRPGQTFQVGQLLILIGFVTQFTGGFNMIAAQYNQLIQYNTDVQTTAVITEAYQQRHRPEAGTHLPAGWKNIQIKRLSFSYGKMGASGESAATAVHRPGTDPPHTPRQSGYGLHDLHLHLRRGQRIALIGKSGSGKSTLLSLLRGLYTPQPGVQLTADDNAFAWESIYNTVTLFPQEPEIFENTIAYNITLGISCSEEEIRQVCEIACFTQVIEQLPEGVGSTIREKGVNLSGGQKQRLALARGILAARNSGIILLDEPTSSVDPQTEASIYNGLFKAFSDKIVVSSLHNLDLLGLFDYVYVLEHGRIVSEGTPAAFAESSYWG